MKVSMSSSSFHQSRVAPIVALWARAVEIQAIPDKISAISATWRARSIKWNPRDGTS
jgi:hypothetical protein